MAAEDVILASQSKLGTLLAPISGGGEGGVGADVSYDEAFEGMKNEVDKLQSMAGDKPNWGNIVSTADEILTEKSKDYRVAVYWAAGRGHLDGLSGLLEGLVLMRDISAAFWEPMYPALKRPKARGNLVAWYSDFLAPAVAAIKPTTKDADAAAAVDTVSRAVDADLREKLGENYPGMGALREAIRNLLQIVPKEAPPPPPVAQAPAPAPGAQAAPSVAAPQQSFGGGGGGGLTVASIVNAATATTAIVQCGLMLARAGDALRAADPADAVAYRISRTGMWLELDATPPAEGAMTLVPPPPEGLRGRFDAAIAAENWLEVLAAADEIGSEYILWLDPHRYAANAMDRLGALFINAKKTLLREVAIVLARAPKLPSLQFNDGTPFADGQTKMWLDAEVASVFGAAAVGGGGGGGGAGHMEGPIGEARGLAASGKLDEAIALLGKAAAGAPSPAERFRGRLAQAKLCLQAEQFAVARAQLEGLDKIAGAHRLTEWEPELCAEMYSALYEANRGMNRGQEVLPEARAREEDAFAKLCQLDPAAALKLGSGT
jgi:type VI secretion system protein VasJ